MQQRDWSRVVQLAVIAVIAIVMFVRFTHTIAATNDFRAFYCAGRAVAAHANPYLIEPLRTCETALNIASSATVPAPLPGYVFAPLALLSHLPYNAAAIAVSIFDIACLVLTALILARLFGAAPLFVFAALVPIGYVCVALGQFPPLLVIVSLALAAAFLAKERWIAAGIASCVTLVEPHIGVPVVLSSLLWIPRSRFTVIACIAALFAISVLTIGWAGQVQYVTQVLPSHARGELHYPMQYSASWLSYTAGAPERSALLVGGILYVLMIAALLPLIRRFAMQMASTEALVLLAPLPAFVGAVYLHVAQLVVLVPAALFLLYRSSLPRNFSALTVLLVAVPWLLFAVGSSSVFLAFTVGAVFLGGLYFFSESGRSKFAALLPAAGLTLATIALIVLVRSVPFTQIRSVPPTPLSVAQKLPRTALATRAWQVAATRMPRSTIERSLLPKIPTWAGILIMFAGVIYVSRTSKRAAYRASSAA